MSQRKTPAPEKKRVWRVSAKVPQGEFVDANAPPDEPLPVPAAKEWHTPGWVMSSFELTYGLDIVEDNDTVPGELLDELFGKPTPPK